MWHVHNSASSGGEDGDVCGWCLGEEGILRTGKVSCWLVVMLGDQSKEVKGTEEDKGVTWIRVLAKGQEDLTYSQLRSAFISMNCAQGLKEKGGWRGLAYL